MGVSKNSKRIKIFIGSQKVPSIVMTPFVCNNHLKIGQNLGHQNTMNEPEIATNRFRRPTTAHISVATKYNNEDNKGIYFFPKSRIQTKTHIL